ncbi:unnamed protein product [Arctia plantaginis]|uniref:Glycolipid transfer protein domain-containing protein n=1 Tax=Arctia plantaginis TaxID=874455 RepID=A0A8S0ZTN8_ARCPL|nr:unnamed protein product [Arctia plantaginis]
MASPCTSERFFFTVKHFPAVIDERLNIMAFVEASLDLVAIVERLGTVFTPVTVDMQGNIDKIKKSYKYDENSCLLELMLDEKAKGETTAAEGVLWLNRALFFFELIFIEIINKLKDQIPPNDVNMKEIFTKAYEGSVKPYHNWITRQLFSFLCKMSPNLPQLLKSLEIDNLVKYIQISESYNVKLHLIRCKIDDFLKDNNIP